MNPLTIVAKVAINQWITISNHATKLLNQLTDLDLEKPVAPGKSSGKYIIGHLIVIHDAIPQILDLGEPAYPELNEVYLKNPDGHSNNPKTIQELRALWTEIHERVANCIKEMPHQLWLTRHNAITDQEFNINPLRNRLSVLINRTNHFAYHVGQLRLLIS